MRDRPIAPTRARGPLAISIDVALCTPHGRRLAVLLVRARERDRWALPNTAWVVSESLDETAARIATHTLGRRPAWLAQLGGFGDAARHPAGVALSVGFIGVTPEGSTLPGEHARWFSAADLPSVAPRHTAIVEAAFTALRNHLDRSPIAFRLQPPAFTLSALQATYELLLGRQLHKASFRRALHAAYVVKATKAWRSEGRGRPAQLFRYAPSRRSSSRRGVRFDLLRA